VALEYDNVFGHLLYDVFFKAARTFSLFGGASRSIGLNVAKARQIQPPCPGSDIGVVGRIAG